MKDMMLGIAIILFGILLTAGDGVLAVIGILVGAFGLVIATFGYRNAKDEEEKKN